MAKSNPLRDMSGTCPPYQGILERLLQRPVNLIADILDRRVTSHDQRLIEIGFFALSVLETLV